MNTNKNPYSRIYICHTFYHVYIATLKELALGEGRFNEATILLSTMSNDFGDLKERLLASNIFYDVMIFEEKHREEFRELDFFNKSYNNIVVNMFHRIRFTKLLGELQKPFVPVNFKNYDNIYVFCDSDPIGYYLNRYRIRYHALEDGLNCIKNFDTARYDNRGFFKLKVFMSSINMIFIQNGYGKYCLDMEVNNISDLKYPCKKYIEVPRSNLVTRLSENEKQLLINIFIKDIDKLSNLLNNINKNQESVIILTEPLCSLDVRVTIFKDIIKQYGENKIVILKQHPRDLLDYSVDFSNYILIDKDIPMEVLNFFGENRFDSVISVFTEVEAIKFAKHKIKLGESFLDSYEDPKLHRQNDYI